MIVPVKQRFFQNKYDSKIEHKVVKYQLTLDFLVCKDLDSLMLQTTD